MKTEVSGPVSESHPSTVKRRNWLSPVEFAIVLLIIAALLAALVPAVLRPSINPREPKRSGVKDSGVDLVIDFGNGVRWEFADLPWREAMRVGDLMHAASLRSPGLNYQVRGSGEMTLLSSLDGVANGEVAGRYWLYEINGRPGNVSFAVKPVAPGDRVLWVFKRSE